jgi:hypothetical protein
MSYEEFMEDPYMDEVGGVFTCIARAMVQPAYQGWQFGGNPKLFPYAGSKEDGLIAREQCAEYCQGDNSYPQAGLLTTVYRDDMPGHPDGGIGDIWYDFVPTFHSQSKYTGQVDVTGEFPYDLVVEKLKTNPSVFNQVQWCELSQPVDNVREPKRDKEASKYARRVYVVERVFKDKETAYAAANMNTSTDDEIDDFGDFGEDTLSEFAINNGYSSVEILQRQSQNIHDAIAMALKGENTPDNKPMNNKEAVNMVCDDFGIKPNDLKLLEVEIVF